MRRRGDDARDDRALLAAHVAGDPDAFTVLVRRHRDRLWAVALRTMRDREDAADALQDALLSAFRNAAAYRGDAAVTTWLHRVVVNACLDRMRRRAVRPSVPLGDTDVPAPYDEHAAARAPARPPAGARPAARAAARRPSSWSTSRTSRWPRPPSTSASPRAR